MPMAGRGAEGKAVRAAFKERLQVHVAGLIEAVMIEGKPVEEASAVFRKNLRTLRTLRSTVVRLIEEETPK
jgi:hypothetical protein